MDTKTVILRPVGSEWYAMASSNSSLVPSDTPEENAYQLVNEADADDDATYISPHGSISFIVLYIDIPEGKTVLSIKLHIRARAEGTKSAFGCIFSATSSDPNVSGFDSSKISLETAGSGWNNYVVELNDSTDETIMAMNSASYTTWAIRICGGENLSESGSKSGTTTIPVTYITQVYLELIYEEPETATPIYLRENGAWNAVSGIIYRKENGAWVEADDTVFTQGDQFALNVIN